MLLRSLLAACAVALLLAPASRTAAFERRNAVVRAVEKVGPAVVNISTEQIIEREQTPFPMFRDPLFDQFFRDFLGPRRERFRRSSLGSGVVIRADGYILTNQHVILRGSRVRVTLADERDFEASLVGTDSDSDLAVLKVDAPASLPAAELGDSDDLMIGETVIAIGNPFGLSHTVTTGVISAVGRSVTTDDQTFYDFIQTDASINPGNSGGPLLDVNGELVGINSAIYQAAQGIGFAIPANRARRVMQDLITYGQVQLPWVGALVQDMSEELARHFGRRDRKGALVRAVEDDSPAAAAGVKPGDIVTAVDGHRLHSSDEYHQRVRDHAPGSAVQLELWRDTQPLSLTVRSSAFPPERADALAWGLLGLRLKESRQGLRVTAVRRDSPCARIGIARGDAIVELAGSKVNDLGGFRRKLFEVRGGRTLLLSVRRGRRVYRVRLPLTS